MINALKEFTNLLDAKGLSIEDVKCASIELCTMYGTTVNVMNLYLLWDEGNLNRFLDSLDFDYDNGFGTQHLFGTIWFNDGTWATRWEYDGSEGWVYHKVPPVVFADDRDPIDYWDGDITDPTYGT